MRNLRRDGHADESEFRPELRPGPHVSPDGKRHPPVRSLRTMLDLAQWGNPPGRWSVSDQERFLATMIEDPKFRAAVRNALARGA